MAVSLGLISDMVHDTKCGLRSLVDDRWKIRRSMCMEESDEQKT